MKTIATFMLSALCLTTTTTVVAANAESAKAALPDLAAAEAKFSATCASCHAADGNSTSPEIPKLAGQYREYLTKQLMEFKSEKHKSAVMSGMAAALSDDEIKGIAAWLAQQKPKAGFAKDKENIALGERIYRGGIADRQIAACAGCHGPTGAGIPSQYPRLSGQNTQYSVAQLKAFRDGVRKNGFQMNAVAAKLNDREINAVADYIAGLR